MNTSNLYDVIVVGSGPAGLTAALYTARRTLKTLVVGKDIGGQTLTTQEIENYPGIKLIDGYVLSKIIKEQAESFGAQVIIGEIVKINKQKENFEIITGDNKKFLTKTVIIGIGLIPRKLNVPGEKEFTGKGVSYCATCDSPLFKNKIVGVAGGGNSAIDAADLLSRLAKQVYLIHRGDEFKAEEILVEKVKKTVNIKIILNTEVKEILGDKFVKGLKLVDKEGKESQIEVNGLFIEIGRVPKTDFLKGFVDLDERGQVKISKDCETSLPGIFAAGDVTDITFKQISIAVGEGTKAALKAYEYIASREGKTIISYR